MKKYLIMAVPAICLFLFYLFFVNYTTFTEVGIMRNEIAGTTVLQDRAGWHLTPLWVLVAKIDTRPTRVCVMSAGRGFNCKLAQFDMKFYQEFVATEGFRYYWWANRISFNMGYDEEYRGVRDLLRGYAYSAKKYPFVKVLLEYEPQ